MAHSISLNQDLLVYSTRQKHRLLTRVDFEVTEFMRIGVIYALFDVDVTAITNIFRWDTYANGHVDITTDNSNMVAGLSFASATGLITAGSSYGWLQYWGPKATLPDSVALSNNLFGDTDVTSGEALMASGTSGVVDTYGGTTVLPMGVATGDDAASVVANYVLMCTASA